MDKFSDSLLTGGAANWIGDGVILIIILLGAYLGAKKSLSQEIFSWMRSFAAVALAVHFHQFAAEKILTSTLLTKESIITQEIVETAIFLSIWTATFLLATLCIAIQKKIVEIKFIPTLEQSFGSLIGMANTGTLAATFLFFLLLVPFPPLTKILSHHCMTVSYFLTAVAPVYNTASTALTLEKKFQAERYVADVNKRLEEKTPDGKKE
ncbi:MAG: CvpA family protein [Candidatus Aureabacteria bacterium]|nr:CvpA family protein [Candidatus Auribacterota bacterium]